MARDLFGWAESKYYDKPCPVLGIGEYKKDKGNDDFSRKQVWFYVYGEEDIQDEFEERLETLIDRRFVDDDIKWDLMTLYPTHVKNEVNPHMRRLLENLASKTGIKYRQLLKRNTTIEENHELESNKAKVVNLEGSIDVEDFKEKNVILVDNLALSGTSVLHGANKLLEKGAENVFAVCLGLGVDFEMRALDDDIKASKLLKERV